MDNRPTQTLKRPRNAVAPQPVRELVVDARIVALEVAVQSLLERAGLPPLEVGP